MRRRADLDAVSYSVAHEVYVVVIMANAPRIKKSDEEFSEELLYAIALLRLVDKKGTIHQPLLLDRGTKRAD